MSAIVSISLYITFDSKWVIAWHGAFDNKTPKCLQLITLLDAMRHVSRLGPKGLGKLFHGDSRW